MQPVLITGTIIAAIILLLVMGTSVKPLKWAGQGAVRIIIGAVFLFFLNVLGGQIGIHVPINPFTAVIAGILGIPGVGALAALDYWVM